MVCGRRKMLPRRQDGLGGKQDCGHQIGCGDAVMREYLDSLGEPGQHLAHPHSQSEVSKFHVELALDYSPKTVKVDPAVPGACVRTCQHMSTYAFDKPPFLLLADIVQITFKKLTQEQLEGVL
jgi:hypothetical protein